MTTVHLRTDSARQQQLLHLLDWLKEIGLVFSYDVEKNAEVKKAAHAKSRVRENLSDAAVAALKKAEDLKLLAFNWDGYQAAPPSAAAIMNSQAFIRKADQDGMKVYFVAPGRSGEVLVEFKNANGRAAEVYFEPNGGAELLMYENDECVLEDDLFSNYEKLITFLL